MTTQATTSVTTTPSRRPRAGRAMVRALVAGLALPLALTACTVSDPDGDGATVVGQSGQSGQPAAADGASAAADGAPGTRRNPVLAGTTVKIGDWQVALGLTNLNANDQVAAENQFNAPPATGRQFVLVPVQVTYTGTESGTAWVNLSIKFYGAGGNTFGGGPNDSCGVVPHDLIELGEMFPGANGSGNECVSVPADQVAGGAWIVEESFALDDNRVFFALK
ncbi:hypothetical protein [Pseudofrankia sp. BMG5.37]|uniref:hypothetical protein n=1 Tax=Pseudofrankia sp. BMG5.37 TaxID=3050035 RepID=UPI0028940BE0|nr:hypothetical protein [Pseudofrankia sp. BMG5.37]MDT3439010.1 hypothetical protein [Pseudofrankia sp. BMG5.37]